MTNLNTASLFSFAASGEAMRIATAERGAEETVAAQLRSAANNTPFPIGSTVTARYQYKVAADGSLVPTQTQVTTEVEDETVDSNGRRSQRQLYRENENQGRASFADILRPKPSLSPSDEIAIFATLNNAQIEKNEARIAALQASTPDAPAFAEAVDSDGMPVLAEILTPQTARAEGPKPAFSPSAQFSVATLYARNNDVVYNVTPIAQLAA